MDNVNSNIKLPPEIEEILYSKQGQEANLAIADDHYLVNSQIAKMTLAISGLFDKSIEIRTVDKYFQQQMPEKEAATIKELVSDILGKRLLIVDQTWFDGKVAEKISAMGGNPADFQPFIEEFKSKMAAEKQAKEEEKKREEEERLAMEREEAEQEMPLVLKDPEAEKAATKRTFSGNLKDILLSSEYKVKLGLNSSLLILLTNDETEQLQKELLDTLYENKEVLTTDKISLKGEMVDPTIGNWLADYIRFTGEEFASTIKRAQYITDSENPKKLKPEEKDLLKRLLDLYVGLRNFYANAGRMNLVDIQIIPLTAEEKALWDKEKSSGQQSSEELAEKMISSGDVDIAKLYEGNPEENEKIGEEKERIATETRREYTRVADVFEDLLLSRKRHGIIACLEILAETHALDNLIAKDSRFTNFLLAYFKRNNLASEADGFKADPYQEKYVRYFLKYVLMERLGLADNEAARYASRLSEIFGSVGSPYTQLAYLDLNDYKFKWGD